MAQSPQSTILFAPPSNFTNNTISEKSWKFLFLKISSSASDRLSVTGLFYILIGLISIGLEAGVLAKQDKNASHPIIYDYDLFGIYLFALGVTLIILCRLQVYVLTSVFILHFFELIYLIQRVATYSLIITNWDNRCVGSNPDLYCESTIRSLLIASLISASIAICLVIFTMVAIKRACDPQSRLAPQQQLQPMPISYYNAAATVTT